MSEETKSTRTYDPITTATARVRKAKRELLRVTKLHAKRTELPSLEAAQSEFDSASAALQDALEI